ncbi:type I restriction endonuclease subunit R [Bythopirellula goksoeyrii]|uniref:Type I restriction enzyme EcoKI subunit R n=1 Tax=Bythopirellula goksoeyrii TaxID=1400387 RepID=A0A5B9QEJ6_9BACT|nr:type I restriction-modification enzyme R subunit C-terminal domain-containing protein [Bythopirellula goksoeyrii]QEG32753.1 type I restriction enzyme EcoKI subunit R [Bythopirellula goksoeyrii]
MPNSSRESERLTRKKRIDPKLKTLGWEIVPFQEGKDLAEYSHHAIEEFPTDKGPVDYALVVNGQLLGVIEAKKVALGPQGVLQQAERYAKGISASPFNYRGFRVPFLFSSNGEVIYFHDVRHELELSRKIVDFYTPAALTELLATDLDEAHERLRGLPQNQSIRACLLRANDAIEQALANRTRQMLVAMATGTGKTYMSVNQIYRLMKSGTAKRILFLVDRRALAAQTVRAFASFEAEPGLKFDQIYEVYSQSFQMGDFDEEEKFDPKVLPKDYLVNPTPGHAFVYVCTIQRMTINLFGRQAVFQTTSDEEIDEDAEQLKIPIHAFDLIIADECHRGYTTGEVSVWRDTLNHFDATRIGLTATPAAHTKAYFKNIVFRYPYEDAVRDGYLVDYNAVKVRSDVRMNGIFLNEGEEVDIVDPDSGAETRDSLEDERQFESTEVERKVTSPDSNRKIAEELKKYADEHEQATGRFPKTLIFAANDIPHMSHADQLVEICREVFGRGDAFVRKITGRVDRPLQQIREFRNRQKPGIVVTVDLLTTGVDIPDLEFIVFLRPVKSRILFEQMMGRGTRKGEHHPDKSHFLVFDCFDGTLLEYFRNATGITAEPPDMPARTIRQIIDDIWSNRDREYNIRCLVKRLQRIEKNMDASAREQFAAFGIADGDVGKYACALPRKLKEDFVETMKLLRKSDFQDLLENYPRQKKLFIRAPEHEDIVTSEYLIRDGKGNEYKPADYLAAFQKFVDENTEKVAAIGILLDRPRDWNTAALTELKDKLSTAPERFTLENLQRAHEMHYHKALVEIISMVKHAADEAQPLLTAEERIDRAFAKLTAKKTFTDQQQQWLDRIHDHLVTSLTIDQEDFLLMPVFEQSGGWVQANRVFEGKLDDLLLELNEAIAA